MPWDLSAPSPDSPAEQSPCKKGPCSTQLTQKERGCPKGDGRSGKNTQNVSSAVTPVAFPPWKKVGPSVQLTAVLFFPQSYGWPLLTNSLLAAIRRTTHLQICSSVLVRPSEPQTRRLQGARARLCVSTRCNTLPNLTRAFFCFPHCCPQKSGAQGLRAACFVNL